jgi:hypothetical protein
MHLYIAQYSFYYPHAATIFGVGVPFASWLVPMLFDVEPNGLSKPKNPRCGRVAHECAILPQRGKNEEAPLFFLRRRGRRRKKETWN